MGTTTKVPSQELITQAEFLDARNQVKSFMTMGVELDEDEGMVIKSEESWGS